MTFIKGGSSWNKGIPMSEESKRKLILTKSKQTPLHEWLADKFTKICVSVSSEKELLNDNQIGKEK